jgi:hypothetical protein
MRFGMIGDRKIRVVPANTSTLEFAQQMGKEKLANVGLL